MATCALDGNALVKGKRCEVVEKITTDVYQMEYISNVTLFVGLFYQGFQGYDKRLMTPPGVEIVHR